MKKLCFALLVGSMLAVPASAANLLVNGGFDDDASVAPGGFTIYNDGDTVGGGGWSVVGNGNNVGGTLSTSYAEAGVAFPAQAGANSYDITGAGNTGPANGVFQNVATVAGRDYQLTFYVGNATGDGTGNSAVYTLPSTIGLSVDGGAQATFTNATVAPGTVTWRKFNQRFTATGTTTNIAFNNATPGGDNFAGLDSVSLAAVPEPATWAMMIGGVGLVGGSLRRRRRTTTGVAFA